MSIAVLALQGDFAAHAAAFRDIGVPVREVRRVAELEGLAGIVIPGGESRMAPASRAWVSSTR